MSTITKEVLENLYIAENKNDKEIAKFFGLSFVTIGNLRRKYGIKGINPQHRKFIDNPQSELTHRQKSILFGSLLGDSCIKSRNNSSAYLSVSHSNKQKSYIDWLYEEFKSICVRPPQEYISKGKYITYELASESRKDLKEIKNKVYTPVKKINSWWLEQIDDLSLAVWYMDDGTLSYINKIKSIFSFATNSFTMEENYLLSNMLDIKFNIKSEVKPINKKDKIQYNLLISDCSFEDFKRIIAPNIVKDLHYKLPGDSHFDSLRNNIENGMSKKDFEDMYINKKMTQLEIANALGVHKSTISKYMNLFSIKPRNNKDSQLGGKNCSLVRSPNGTFVNNMRLSEVEEERVKQIFSELKEKGFPHNEIKSDEHYIGILDSLAGNKICNVDNGDYCYSRSGIELCSSFFPQIFSMASNGSKTPIEIFKDDGLLYDCIRRTIKYAKKDSIAAVRQGLKTYRGNRCVTIFPPMWAKTILKITCDRDNLSLLDFSCGFGGRLIGSYASGKIKRYVGIDPIAENINSHKKIDELVKKHLLVRPKEFSSEFICGCAENVIPSLKEKFDVILSCPPYFSKEIYTNNIDQCYNKYMRYDDWKTEWLYDIMKKSYGLLNYGGKMIIFISDYEKYNTGTDCRDILKQISGKIPNIYSFLIPSLEYNRAKRIRKVDTAWVIEK